MRTWRIRVQGTKYIVVETTDIPDDHVADYVVLLSKVYTNKIEANVEVLRINHNINNDDHSLKKLNYYKNEFPEYFL